MGQQHHLPGGPDSGILLRLAVPVRRDISAKKVSPVTLFYGVLGLAITVLVVYALISPDLH